MFEFGFGAKKYRDELANELVETRSDNEEKPGVVRADAVNLLKKEQKTEMYKYSKDLLKSGLKPKKDIFQDKEKEEQIENLEWGQDFGGVDHSSFISRRFGGREETMSVEPNGWCIPSIEELKFAFINQLPGFKPACYWSRTTSINGVWHNNWYIDMRTGEISKACEANGGEMRSSPDSDYSDFRVRFVRNPV